MNSARPTNEQKLVTFLDASEKVKQVINMINNFTSRSVDVSDDIIMQLVRNAFKHDNYDAIIESFCNLLPLNLSTNLDELAIHCRVVALFINHVSNKSLRSTALILLSNLAALEITQKTIHQLALGVALGRMTELTDEHKKSLINMAITFIQPGRDMHVRLMACRILESVGSVPNDFETLTACVRELFSYVDDDSQEICDLSRCALINIMFSASDFDTNLVLNECLTAQMRTLKKKVESKKISKDDERKLFGFSVKEKSEAVDGGSADMEKQFQLFKTLLEKAAFVQDYLEDCVKVNAKIPVAVIFKMVSHAFGTNANAVVDFFLDKITPIDHFYFTDDMKGKLDLIATQVVQLYADQVTSKEVKQKAKQKLSDISKNKNDISVHDVLLARFGDELNEDELYTLFKKASSWIDGSTVENDENTMRQVCASHILGALGATVNQDKYKRYTSTVRYQCVEGLVSQIKMGERFRDDYLTSVVCHDLIEIMRHTSKLGMAVIMAQCLAHTLAEQESNALKMSSESTLKPQGWRSRMFGLPSNPDETGVDSALCLVM